MAGRGFRPNRIVLLFRQEVADRSPQARQRGGRVIDAPIGQAQGKDMHLDAATLQFQDFLEHEVV